MINKPFPEFAKYDLSRLTSTITSSNLKGRVSLLVIWSSWCKDCDKEFLLLSKLAHPDYDLIGLNYRDERDDALEFLNVNGNPFSINIFDPTGNLGSSIGAYDVPEAYVIDKDAIIRYKIISLLSDDILETKIMPIINLLNQD